MMQPSISNVQKILRSTSSLQPLSKRGSFILNRSHCYSLKYFHTIRPCHNNITLLRHHPRIFIRENHSKWNSQNKVIINKSKNNNASYERIRSLSTQSSSGNNGNNSSNSPSSSNGNGNKPSRNQITVNVHKDKSPANEYKKEAMNKIRNDTNTNTSTSSTSARKVIPSTNVPQYQTSQQKRRQQNEHAMHLKMVQDDDSTSSTINPPSSNISQLKPSISQQQQHNHTHFVRGGTPCDPAPSPFHLADYGDESLYTLVLLRHGESEWNSQNKYTGWCDVNLTNKGENEAQDAGRLLLQNNIELDHIFTSVLKRAINTTTIALNEAKQHWVPITKSWRLNERHYGALQGYNKDTAYDELGYDQELVMEMRRSYKKKPPLMEDDHPFWHGHDRRYKHLSDEQLENTRAESLEDTANRILPFYQSQIIPSLRSGNKCMIVSHANSLRSLVKHIDNISDEDIKGMSIPTGIPLLYRLDKNMKPVDPKMELEVKFMIEPKGYTWGTSRQYGFHGVYLGDLKRLQEIQMKRDATNRDWQRIILRNIARQLDDNLGKVGAVSDGVMEIRQLYFQIHMKSKEKELGNMLLLVRMKRHLEQLMSVRKQKYLTMEGFEAILNKLHLDTEGRIVEPFKDLNVESGSPKWEGL